jgi:hypothetical protein
MQQAGRLQLSSAIRIVLALTFFWGMFLHGPSGFAQLSAGTGKSNITAVNCGEVHDSLYVRALVLESGPVRVAVLSMDVIAIGGIGDIPDSFLPSVSGKLKKGSGITHVLACASHNHLDGFLNDGGKISPDVEKQTILAVQKALKNLEPVKAGAGEGFENRFAMNRRIRMKDGKVFTIRHANPNRPDELIEGIDDTDPAIGILKLERMDGTVKAVLFNYACHPYTGVPGKGVTAEFPGLACRFIENQLGHQSIAFFIQGAAGDVTEILYKDRNHPRDCTAFGQMLGLSTLEALKTVQTSREKNKLAVICDSVSLPLRTDIPVLLDTLVQRENRLLHSLRSTSLDMKSFIPLYIRYSLSPDFPSYSAEQYLFEKNAGIPGLEKMDEANKKDLDKYRQNVLAMEKLTQIQEDRHQLLLRQADMERMGKDHVPARLLVLRIGDFVLVSFPGEAFTKTGLDIKNSSPFPHTYLAGYSNGYFHYAPDSESYAREGYEVMNCILAPQWEEIYMEKIRELIKKL